VNRELASDALYSSNGSSVDEKMPYEFTSLEAGPSLGANTSSDGSFYLKLLFAVTATGSVVIFSWKRGPQEAPMATRRSSSRTPSSRVAFSGRRALQRCTRTVDPLERSERRGAGM